MLAFGFRGEASSLPAFLGFMLGMCGRGYILPVVSGLGSEAAACNKYVTNAFDTMRFLVTVSHLNSRFSRGLCIELVI